MSGLLWRAGADRYSAVAGGGAFVSFRGGVHSRAEEAKQTPPFFGFSGTQRRTGGLFWDRTEEVWRIMSFNFSLCSHDEYSINESKCK